jgi:hypothetical protein
MKRGITVAKTAFFMKRLNDHIQYLKKIDATLNNKGDFQGIGHEECLLGTWLYGEGAAEVKAIQNSKAKEIFDSLLEPHQKFHTMSRQALENKLAGDEAGMKAALTEMHLLSTILTNKLLDLDGMS